MLFCIDGQVRLVRLFLLQTKNFRLFLRQQTEKRQTSVYIDEQTVNGSRKIARASIFRLMSPCLHVHISTLPEFRKRRTELMVNSNFRFIFCKQSKIAVSANVPIYRLLCASVEPEEPLDMNNTSHLSFRFGEGF